MIASDALARAVYSALNGNITGAVVEETRPNQPAPYTVLGESTEVPDDTHASEGSEETMTLHIWDSMQSYERIDQIAAEIDALLHNQTLTLAGGAVAFVRRVGKETFPDADEPGRRWRHGVLRYRATIMEAA